MYHVSFIGRIASALIIACLAGASLPFAAKAQSTGSLTGRVLAPDSSPIVGAFISIDDAPPATQSAADGTFRIDSVSIGDHIVHTRRSGYMESVDSVTVTQLAAAQLNVSLTVKAAMLAGVTVIGTKTDLA